MFRNILVAVDDSQAAELALIHAVDLAERGRSRLTLLTAAAQPSRLASLALGATGMLRSLEGLEAEAEKIALRARERLPRDLPVTGVVSKAPVKRAIVDQITAGHHDLIVMGSRGGGVLRSTLRGSICGYVLQRSPVPVLLVSADPSHDGESASSLEQDGTPEEPERGAGAEAA
ncbi:MAG TPA: universal stress protein [Solirubrobacteraceae bacterium]|nr:universal stress protein [Solirubrobacteraceae bacterium]